MDKGEGGSVLGPPRPHEHDFSQQSLSSLRSTTVVTTNNNNNSLLTNNNDNNDKLSNNNQPSNDSRELSRNNLEVESDQPSQPMTSQTMITGVTTNNNDSNINQNNNNNNQDESQETQETFTQQLTQNDMTQLGFDSDNDDLDESQQTQSSQFECSNSPTPIDPLTVPWGRLMPVGLDSNEHQHQGAMNNGNGGRPSSGRGATEMLPRSPLRNDAGSPHEGDTVGGLEGSSQLSPSSQCIQFLGLKNLLVSDRFNEYVLGRSVKVS